MTVNEMTVSMLMGVKLQDMWGARGKFVGSFIGFGRKLNARTFAAMKRQGIIEVAHDTSADRIPTPGRIITYRLTKQGALLAETLLLHDERWSSEASEHRFVHLVEGAVIFYGYMIEDCHEERGYWVATHPVTRHTFAKGRELKDCIAAARLALEPKQVVAELWNAKNIGQRSLWLEQVRACDYVQISFFREQDWVGLPPSVRDKLIASRVSGGAQ
jgi:hypothetical protein